MPTHIHTYIHVIFNNTEKIKTEILEMTISGCPVGWGDSPAEQLNRRTEWRSLKTRWRNCNIQTTTKTDYAIEYE